MRRVINFYRALSLGQGIEYSSALNSSFLLKMERGRDGGRDADVIFWEQKYISVVENDVWT